MTAIDAAREEIESVEREIYSLGYDRNAALHAWSENKSAELLAAFQRIDSALPGKLDDANKRKGAAIEKLNTALAEFQRSCFQEKT